MNSLKEVNYPDLKELYKINSDLAMKEEIFSVPCILIFKDCNCVEKIYAIESVPNLYKKISSYL